MISGVPSALIVTGVTWLLKPVMLLPGFAAAVQVTCKPAMLLERSMLAAVLPQMISELLSKVNALPTVTVAAEAGDKSIHALALGVASNGLLSSASVSTSGSPTIMLLTPLVINTSLKLSVLYTKL